MTGSAKQSSFVAAKLDCVVASLLAMTNYLLIVEHFLVRASSASPRAQAKCCDPSLRQNNPTGKSPKPVQPLLQK
jgi:hypothetical protein